MRNIKVKAFSKLPDQLAKVAEQFKKEAYQTGKPPYTEKQRAEHEEKFCSQKDRFKYLLAFWGDEIVGGLTLLKREGVFHRKKILLGGIGGVWTRKDKQKKSVATTMLKKAMKVLIQNHCDIAYLRIETKILRRLYERVGFLMLNRRHTFLGKSRKRYYAKDGMIALVTSKIIFNEILQDKKPFDIGKGNW